MPVLRRATLVAFLSPALLHAHAERPVQFPSGAGRVPEYRTSGPRLLVCAPDTPARLRGYPPALRRWNLELFAECQAAGYHSIQQAVDAVAAPGTRILVQPGHYTEPASLAPPTGECAALAGKFPLSYEEQRACPHLDNLIAVFGDGPDEDIACDGARCDLQIEGTGRRTEDVVIDGGFQKLNVIRADRADGVYFRNFTVQRSTFNALYVLETDGFAIDRLLGRWNDEYGFLTFSSDHGLYVDCEAYGNGDGGLYPGSAADLHGARPAVEITRCRSHHNLIGLSGTAGNSLYVHDNDFYANSTGITLDSAFPGHPGMPQDSSTFIDNRIWGNNQDYYRFHRDGTCSRPSEERGYEQGVVCPATAVPIGTGILIAGGNRNVVEGNRIWDNWRAGAMLHWVPALVRGENDLRKLFDTSHFNRFAGNLLGHTPRGRPRPNGVDFWWDEEGEGNCWEANEAGERGVRSNPAELPACEPPAPMRGPRPGKFLRLLACSSWSPSNVDPAGCNWTRTPRRPRR